MNPEKSEAKSPWGERLKRMKDYQKDHATTWGRNEKLLFGEEQGQDGITKKALSVAYGWGLMRTLKSQVYVQNPTTIATARDPKWAETAKLLTCAVNYDFEQMDVKTSGNLGLIDCMTAGYYASIETVVNDVALRYPLKSNGDPDMDQDPVDAWPRDQQYVTNRIVPRDILFDPQGLKYDLSDHRFIALAFYPTIDQLKNDPTFKGKLPENIDKYAECSPMSRGHGPESTRPTSSQGRPYDEEKDPEYRTICVWEIWDQTQGEIIYITDDRHTEIGKRAFPFKLQIGGRKLYPVTLMVLNPVTTGFYPKPVIDLIAPQLIALNKMDATALEDFTTKLRKWLALASVIGPEQAAKITDPATPYAVIPLMEDGIDEIADQQHRHEFDLRRVVMPMEDIAAERDTLIGIAHVKSEMQEILGWGPLDRGGMPSTRSAREAMAIYERQQASLQAMIDAVDDYYRLIGTKHIQILQQTMVIERYARVRQELQSLTVWKSYSKGDIGGEFEFEVYSGTSGPKNIESKRASELQLFQTVAPILQATGGDIRPAFYRLASFYDWDGVDDLFKGGQTAIQNLAATLVQMSQQAMDPGALLNAAAGAVQANMTEEQIAMLRQRLSGQMGQSGSAPAMKGMRGDAAPLSTASLG